MNDQGCIWVGAGLCFAHMRLGAVVGLQLHLSVTSLAATSCPRYLPKSSSNVSHFSFATTSPPRPRDTPWLLATQSSQCPQRHLQPMTRSLSPGFVKMAWSILRECRPTYYKRNLLHSSYLKELTHDSARRNATKSPLLRLPPEIRNKIWSFAMGGMLVMLPYIKPTMGCAVQIDLKVGGYAPSQTEIMYHNEPVYKLTKQPAAFHLPEVCRQVYAETALTAYEQNVFLCDIQFLSHSVMARLTATQRKAIRSVELAPYLFYDLVKGHQTRFESVTLRLPNIKIISLSNVATESAKTLYNREVKTAAKDKTALRAWVREKVAARYGCELEVQFEGERSQ